VDSKKHLRVVPHHPRQTGRLLGARCARSGEQVGRSREPGPRLSRHAPARPDRTMKLKKHGDHGQGQGEGPWYRRARARAVGDLVQIIFRSFFRGNAGDRLRDAEHRAQETENRHGPGDEPDQRVAALQGDRIVVREAAELVVELAGRAGGWTGNEARRRPRVTMLGVLQNAAAACREPASSLLPHRKPGTRLSVPRVAGFSIRQAGRVPSASARVFAPRAPSAQQKHE